MRAFSATLRAALLAAALAAGGAAASTPVGFADVLQQPARASPLAVRSLLHAVTRAGSRLVAVGARGHALVSTDGAMTWRQAQVPVSSDLTAVFFIDAWRGWAVGHDGVVLHTQDGGESWRLQLDGRRAAELTADAMRRRLEANPSSAELRKLFEEAERHRRQGPDKPFLDVWFADARHGYVVGAFNTILRTEDGGATWTPWFDRTDNPRFLNLYAIREAGGELYVAGENGLVLKLDRAAQRLRKLDVPYEGSFFGLADAGGAVIAFGLRGNAFRSGDAGRTWTAVKTGLPASVVASSRTSRGEVLLADAVGRIALSEDGGHTFTRVPLGRSVPLAGLAEAAPGRLVLVGPRGLSMARLK